MKELANEIVAWLKDYAVKNNRKSWVVGVSGGVDSALVSTLCAMTGLPTHCVVLPCQSKQDGIDKAVRHIEWLKEKFGDSSVNGIHYHCINLDNTFEEFHYQTKHLANDLGDANAKSRLRMIALYHVATCFGGLVVGTGNRVEDYGVFFYTKYGDGGVDIAPIGDLFKSEVRQMCRELGVLPELCEAVPTDGLWDDNRTDESQLGATYEELEWAMGVLETPENVRSSVYASLNKRQWKVLEIYNKWHTAGKHKSEPIPMFRRKK